MTKSIPFTYNDYKIQEVVDIFFQKMKSDGYHNVNIQNAYKVIGLLPQELDCGSISWSFFQDLFNKGLNETIKYDICRLISEFIKNNCYSGEYKEIVNTFKDVFVLGKELFWVFSNSFLPYNLIVIKGTSKSRKTSINNKISCYKNDSSNLFLYELLKDFASHNISGTQLNHEFYSRFQKSLEDKKITKITDFNSKTFKQQYYFYKNNVNSSLSLTFLKKFYLMLLNLPEGRNILHWKDGIDKHMLSSVSFNRNYEEGFIPIPLNPFDPIPELDKWLIIPNGAENYSTKINSFSYKPIDFSHAEDEKLKNHLKDWFWNSPVSLSSRIDHANICIKFINFIFDLRNQFSIKKFTLSDDNFLCVEEIFSYIQFVKGSNKHSSYIQGVRSFLTYLHENNLYNVEASAFKYLVIKSPEVKKLPKDLSDENLIKIDAKLKENIKDSYINTLYYIIFHISLATEFRISQIINLKVNCLKKEGRKDFLVSTTKVSNGEEVKIPITPYTRRYIETAITFTQDVRNSCTDKSIKEHIFIHNISTFNFKVVTVRSFSDNIRKFCLELGIDGITAQNLRDTYMTKSIEYAIKNNLSDLETKALTGHKQISTTTNHYVAEKIKDYLEATHMVVIGNPTIKGKIIIETNHKIEELVNDQCGFCNYESCIKKDSNIDCLMCSGFIATIDRIPFYEEKINRINIEIKSTKLFSEKERLVTIKRLYLAYLAKLLELKETIG